jgi:N6-adenosine-specific RNA methylase IME4
MLRSILGIPDESITRNPYDFPPPHESLRLPSVIRAPRGAHSEKPDEIYEAVERMYPGLQRLELFCRGVPRPGWAAWGNETLRREGAVAALRGHASGDDCDNARHCGLAAE